MLMRSYQKYAFDSVNVSLETHRSCLVVMPTGTGKTILFAHSSKHFVYNRGRVLVLAHTGELVNQAKDKIERTTGIGCAIEKAEETCLNDYCTIVVGTRQTLQSIKRLKKFRKNYFTHIIIDEAHHAVSDSYRRIIDYFESAKIIGVTATHDRSDMKDLGIVFQDLAFEYTLPEAINDGFLVPIFAQTMPIKLDISEASMQCGDFSLNDVAIAVDPYLKAIAKEIKESYSDRKIVVFLPLIATSQKFQLILEELGINTFEVNGDSDNRDQIISDFDKAPAGSVMCNAMLLTEGWDCETVDCILNLRSTKSRPLYAQMVGRGTRTTVASEISANELTSEQRKEMIANSSKPNLLILDCMWNTGKHKLCRPAYLVCDNDDVANQMSEIIDKKNNGVDILSSSILEEAESDVAQQREAAMAKAIKEASKKKKMLVNPLEYEMSIMDKDLSNYKPKDVWEFGDVTEEQKKRLEKLSLYPDLIDTAGKAELLITKAESRVSENKSTPKQIRMLEKNGFVNVSKWDKDQASKMIVRISANGWRVPHGVDPKTYEPTHPKKDSGLINSFLDDFVL